MKYERKFLTADESKYLHKVKGEYRKFLTAMFKTRNLRDELFDGLESILVKNFGELSEEDLSRNGRIDFTSIGEMLMKQKRYSLGRARMYVSRIKRAFYEANISSYETLLESFKKIPHEGYYTRDYSYENSTLSHLTNYGEKTHEIVLMHLKSKGMI